MLLCLFCNPTRVRYSNIDIACILACHIFQKEKQMSRTLDKISNIKSLGISSNEKADALYLCGSRRMVNIS